MVYTNLKPLPECITLLFSLGKYVSFFSLFLEYYKGCSKFVVLLVILFIFNISYIILAPCSFLLYWKSEQAQKGSGGF